jgi:hypothetical protein
MPALHVEDKIGAFLLIPVARLEVKELFHTVVSDTSIVKIALPLIYLEPKVDQMVSNTVL